MSDITAVYSGSVLAIPESAKSYGTLALLNPVTSTTCLLMTMTMDAQTHFFGVADVTEDLHTFPWRPLLLDPTVMNQSKWKGIPLITPAHPFPKDPEGFIREITFALQYDAPENRARVNYTQLWHQTVLSVVARGSYWSVTDLSGKTADVTYTQLQEIRTWPCYFASSSGGFPADISDLVFRSLRNLSKQNTMHSCTIYHTDQIRKISHEEQVSIARRFGVSEPSAIAAFIRMNFI